MDTPNTNGTESSQRRGATSEKKKKWKSPWMCGFSDVVDSTSPQVLRESEEAEQSRKKVLLEKNSIPNETDGDAANAENIMENSKDVLQPSGKNKAGINYFF